jgi:hypothetical protein
MTYTKLKAEKEIEEKALQSERANFASTTRLMNLERLLVPVTCKLFLILYNPFRIILQVSNKSFRGHASESFVQY